MHEVGMIRAALATVLSELDKSGGQRVAGVRLAVKASGHATEEAIRDLFAALAGGTPASGAVVSIEWLPSEFQCVACANKFVTSESGSGVTCPRCGGSALDLDHQDTCTVTSIDVAFDDDPR